VRGHEVETRAPEETEALGAAIGRAAQGGELIGLVGELGSGKTCFVRGLAAGLGIDAGRITSPSFTIVSEHRGGRLVLQHVDLYRLEPSREDERLLRDVLYGQDVAAVEWFDRLRSADGDEVLLVRLDFAGDERRAVRLEARGARHERLLRLAFGA